MEKLRVVIASDKTKVNLRPELKRRIEEIKGIEGVFLSRVKISRIKGEIKPKNPDSVLVTAALKTDEEFRELRGFVRILKKHLPEINIVVHTPRLSDPQRESIFQVGANGWIHDEIENSSLGRALKDIAAGEEISDSSVITKKRNLRKK